MLNRWLSLIALAIAVAPLPAHAYRSFSMGFTDSPYDLTIEARDETWGYISTYGDLAVIAEDGKVPWDAALTGDPAKYPQSYLGDIQYRMAKRNALLPGKKVNVYINFMGFDRSTIAGNVDENGGAPFPPFWEARKTNFLDPYVLQAFINHCEILIRAYRPDYFGYSTEANMMLDKVFKGEVAPETWYSFVVASSYVYQVLKARHPSIRFYVSLQNDFFYADQYRESVGLAPLMKATDLLALSSYGYFGYPDPAKIPADYYTAIRKLAPSLPYAIAETGWPSQDVLFPDPLPQGATPLYYIPESQQAQLSYMGRILGEATANSAVFVNWYVVRNYWLAWNRLYSQLPLASTIRVWRDDGILNAGGQLTAAGWSWYLQYLFNPRLPEIQPFRPARPTRR